METETELQRGNGRQRNRKGSDDRRREGVCVAVCVGAGSACSDNIGTRTPCRAALSLKQTGRRDGFSLVVVFFFKL